MEPVVYVVIVIGVYTLVMAGLALLARHNEKDLD